jgi:hypothetical protein
MSGLPFEFMVQAPSYPLLLHTNFLLLPARNSFEQYRCEVSETSLRDYRNQRSSQSPQNKLQVRRLIMRIPDRIEITRNSRMVRVAAGTAAAGNRKVAGLLAIRPCNKLLASTVCQHP